MTVRNAPTRKAMTPARTRRIMLNTAEAQGNPIRCALCNEPIRALESVTMEHLAPFALGGADDDGEDNVRPVHTPCAMRKTAGTAATGHRGDTANIARANRLANGGRNKGPGPQGRSTFQSGRKLEGGGKLQSRPFATAKRKMMTRPIA